MTERPITSRDLARMLTEHFYGVIKFNGQVRAQKGNDIFYSERGNFVLEALRLINEANPDWDYMLYKDKRNSDQFFSFKLGNNKAREVGEGRNKGITTNIEYPTNASLQIFSIENLRLSDI